MKLNISALCLMLCTSASAFVPLQTSSIKSTVLEEHQSQNQDNRRSFLVKTVAALPITFIQPQKSFADVSDGNSLPDGAAQFSRILKTKTDLAGVINRVKDHGDEIDAKEWEAISVFLRKVYSAGDDMKFTAKSMVDYKKKSADDIVKELQKLAIAGDIPAQKNDAAGFLTVANRITKDFDGFLDLLSDVPDL